MMEIYRMNMEKQVLASLLHAGIYHSASELEEFTFAPNEVAFKNETNKKIARLIARKLEEGLTLPEIETDLVDYYCELEKKGRYPEVEAFVDVYASIPMSLPLAKKQHDYMLKRNIILGDLLWKR